MHEFCIRARNRPENFLELKPEPDPKSRLVSNSGLHNEMIGVLARVSAGAAGRILNTADPREIRA